MSLTKTTNDWRESMGIVASSQGEALYECSEQDLAVFSTVKLIDIITLSEMIDGFFQETFIEEVSHELIRRDDWVETHRGYMH